MDMNQTFAVQVYSAQTYRFHPVAFFTSKEEALTYKHEHELHKMMAVTGYKDMR